MKYKSPVYSQASGSIAGTVHSHNQGGLYTRARSIPTNPNTPLQQAARNALATLSQRWQTTLTDLQRAGWATYAANVPLINALGDTRPIGAIAMYNRCNSPRLQTLGPTAIVDDAPTVYSLGTFTPVSITVVGTAATTTFTNTDDWATLDGGYLMVYMSQQQSPSINFFKGPYRYLSSIAGDTTTPPTAPYAMGVSPSVTPGNAVFIRVQASLADGRLSSSQSLRVIGG